MTKYFFPILGLLLTACSTPKKLGGNPVALKVDLPEIQTCWEKKCTKPYVVARFGFGRENLEENTEANQVVYFEAGNTLPPFTTFSFDHDNRLVHIVHIPKAAKWNKLQKELHCDDWKIQEYSPHIARHMNDVVTDCQDFPLTATYNGSTNQVIKLVWGHHPNRMH